MKKSSINKPCYLIINPNRYPQYVKILRKIIKKYSFFKVVESKNVNHFIECITEYYISKAHYLLIWGGDGTAHAAINCLTRLKIENPADTVKRSVGFLRGGSGNGIQDSYEVPFSIFKQLKTYINSINNDYTIDVDLIKTDYDGMTSYTQLAGLGFDADILELRNCERFRSGPFKGTVKPGLLNYMRAIVKTFIINYYRNKKEFKLELQYGRYLFQGKSVNAQIKIDYLEKRCSPLMLEIGNRPYFAAKFKICPHVVCNNGLMNLYIYNRVKRRTILKNLRYFWTGQHNKINDRFARNRKQIIEHYELKSIQVYSDNPIKFHLDGDLKEVKDSVNGQYSLKFSILPESITFLVPEVFFRKFHPPGIM